MIFLMQFGLQIQTSCPKFIEIKKNSYNPFNSFKFKLSKFYWKLQILYLI